MGGTLECTSEALGGALSVVSPETRTAAGLEQVAGQVSMMFRTQSVRVRNTVMNRAGRRSGQGRTGSRCWGEVRSIWRLGLGQEKSGDDGCQGLGFSVVRCALCSPVSLFQNGGRMR